jgi:hypothetical protein
MVSSSQSETDSSDTRRRFRDAIEVDAIAEPRLQERQGGSRLLKSKLEFRRLWWCGGCSVTGGP